MVCMECILEMGRRLEKTTNAIHSREHLLLVPLDNSQCTCVCVCMYVHACMYVMEGEPEVSSLCKSGYVPEGEPEVSSVAMFQSGDDKPAL